MKRFLNILICLLICHISNAQTETTNWLYNLEGKTPVKPKIQNQNQNNTTALKMLNLSRHFDENLLRWGTGPDLLRVPRILASISDFVYQVCARGMCMTCVRRCAR